MTPQQYIAADYGANRPVFAAMCEHSVNAPGVGPPATRQTTPDPRDYGRGIRVSRCVYVAP